MAISVRPVLPDAYAVIKDGGLGLQAGNLEGIHFKVGVSSAGNINEIYRLTSQRDAIQYFGSGPLVDACVDSFSSGAQVIYAMRANASIDGTIGGSTELWVECMRGGEAGVAQIRYSLDGGVSWSGKHTISQETSTVQIPSRYITIKMPAEFTPEATEEEPSPSPKRASMTGGDLWKFSISSSSGTVLPMGSDTAGTAALEVTAKAVAVVKTGTGSGTLSVGGSPTRNAEVLVQIYSGGGLNEASYRYSLDGGDNWSGRFIVPESGTAEIIDTGIELTFGGSGFEAGDTWQFRTNAPQMSNGDLIESLELIRESSAEFEFIHVVGECGRSTWAACQAMADEMFAEHRYTFFVCEGRNRTPRESVNEWVNSLAEEAGKFAGMRVVVVPARLEMVDMNTGEQVDRNGAAIIAGLISKTPVQASIARVMYNPVTLGLELNPNPQYRTAHIQSLDAAGYTTFRRYVGLSAIYVTNAYTMAEVGSDFKELTYLRVMNKACRMVRTNVLKYLHGEASEKGLRYLKALAESALMTMRQNGEIADSRVNIPPDQNILSTSEVKVEIAIVPIGIIKWICLELGFENPAIREMLNSAS